MKHILRIMLVLIFALSLVLSPQVARAQDQTPECGGGQIGPDCETPPDGTVEAQGVASLASALTTTVKGGYVAHGVGMRNLGYGTIVVDDVPAGSTVLYAYLYWAVIGPRSMTGFSYSKGYINDHAITGSLVGHSGNPCWGVDPIWSYRANVKSWMIKGGNGKYALSGFATGRNDGADPFDTKIERTLPLLDGASLVILYSNPNRPMTKTKIYNGAATTYGGELHQSIAGVNAVGLTGLSSATFIGADGQNLAKPGGYFFANQMAGAKWLGSDPNGNGKNNPKGNLWDTMTVDLTYLVDPPDPDYWFSVVATPDCVTWVAQVTSYSDGNQDTDGDRLKDGWELHGVGSGEDYQDLPGFGADPLHKDLFVEADYMLGSDDHLPNLAQLRDIVRVFADAPVTNPDGNDGINIHIDTGGKSHDNFTDDFDLHGGNSLTETTYLGTSDAGSCNHYNWTEFQNLKNANFNPVRENIFHYMIFAYNLAPGCGTVSGISRNGATDALFIKGATDFIVSMGGWGSDATSTAREGTFIHELGHNLGLRHGGNDHTNYKPNYLSVMNYFFQITGVYYNGTWGHYDYSRMLLPSLNENALNETIGLGHQADNYGTFWYDQNGSKRTSLSPGSGVDWKYDGLTQTSVKVNINDDTSCYPSYCPIYSTLGSQNNWANITFQGGGAIGLGASTAGVVGPLSISPEVNELTLEEYLKDQGQ